MFKLKNVVLATTLLLPGMINATELVTEPKDIPLSEFNNIFENPSSFNPYLQCTYTYKTLQKSKCTYGAYSVNVTNPFTNRDVLVRPPNTRIENTKTTFEQSLFYVPRDPDYRKGEVVDRPPSGEPLVCDSNTFTAERTTVFYQHYAGGTRQKEVDYQATYFLLGGSDGPEYTTTVTYDDERCIYRGPIPGNPPRF